ncbi:POK8 protein, partial [Illadopsis cleaveri]|nr:POK8 protein [Illadopsis cleaveri]
VEHQKGIPYSPTGQAVIERTPQTLKKTLEQQRGDVQINSPHQRLCKALFTMNFLNCSFDNLNPPVLQHFNQNQRMKSEEWLPVLVKDPETWKVQGPYNWV